MPEWGPGERAEQKMEAHVFALGGTVEYQQDSVVSRTLIDRKMGTVTLFAFDRGQGLSEHTAPFDALVCVLDGEAAVTVGGEQFRLRAGEAIIMPAKRPHALQAVDRFKMILVMIRS